jgi:hypothetical protein
VICPKCGSEIHALCGNFDAYNAARAAGFARDSIPRLPLWSRRIDGVKVVELGPIEVNR